jgi:hypothetical protein
MGRGQRSSIGALYIVERAKRVTFRLGQALGAAQLASDRNNPAGNNECSAAKCLRGGGSDG